MLARTQDAPVAVSLFLECYSCWLRNGARENSRCIRSLDIYILAFLFLCSQYKFILFAGNRNWNTCYTPRRPKRILSLLGGSKQWNWSLGHCPCPRRANRTICEETEGKCWVDCEIRIILRTNDKPRVLIAICNFYDDIQVSFPINGVINTVLLFIIWLFHRLIEIIRSIIHWDCIIPFSVCT